MDAGLGEAPDAGRPQAVLVVDDEPDILDSLGLVLKARLSGVKVVTALSGAEALQQMSKQPIGAILTDYKMPKMDGFQFVAEARRIDPVVPVIMMTADSPPQNDGGVGLLVPKPFDMKHMVEILRAALAGKPLVPPGQLRTG